MAKVVGYSGKTLPVDESVYDDNRTLNDKAVVERHFKNGMYADLTLEQQNFIRKQAGLDPLTEETMNKKAKKGLGTILRPNNDG